MYRDTVSNIGTRAFVAKFLDNFYPGLYSPSHNTSLSTRVISMESDKILLVRSREVARNHEIFNEQKIVSL